MRSREEGRGRRLRCPGCAAARPRRRTEGPCGGGSLLEGLVVLVLTAVVGQASWSLLVGQLRAADEVAGVADRLDAARIVRVVLGEELRAGRPAGDWRIPDRDSVLLRAFRGLAFPCPDGFEDGEVRVRVRGLRRPDPDKDSVLLVRPDGVREVRGLETAERSPGERETCPAAGRGERVERWRIGEAAPDFVLARLFERGSYHLADGSFRYRRGEGGRQPLTAEILDDGRSGLGSGSGWGSVRLVLGFRRCADPSCPAPWRASFHSTAP